MPNRIRNDHLANTLEAVIRYIMDDHPVSMISDRADGELVITLRLGDPPAYHSTLDRVTAERPPGAK